ncbi:MAG: RNA polymerase sigma factor [Defluviitaleaceae bacterium]|nr:RNA polymerase sigma factor [Defluviitaleaceae bacterium]
MNEYQLIHKIKKGDRAAADTLIRSYYDEIFRFVRKQTMEEQTALDLTQEIFISLLRTIHSYNQAKGASVRTWLYKIATNKTIDYFRARAAGITETMTLDDAEPIDDTDFTKQISNQDFAERVCVYVNQFSPDTQKIFRLHIFGGYTFAEIATDMQLPEGSIKSKYYRLLNRLRSEFNGG